MALYKIEPFNPDLKGTRRVTDFYQGERTLQQIPMPPEYHDAAKRYGQAHGKSLNQVYDEIVDWFLKAKNKNGAQFPFYLASPKVASKYTSLWLDTALVDKAKLRAKKDGEKLNRVIFTAIVYFLKDKDLL